MSLHESQVRYERYQKGLCAESANCRLPNGHRCSFPLGHKGPHSTSAQCTLCIQTNCERKKKQKNKLPPMTREQIKEYHAKEKANAEAVLKRLAEIKKLHAEEEEQERRKKEEKEKTKVGAVQSETDAEKKEDEDEAEAAVLEVQKATEEVKGLNVSSFGVYHFWHKNL
ncbi:hypothetical protein WR25_14680 [Diploscapter pachys]|uniref:Uncharacterized protein n=1 Tax=Diploscapter pachys TaxID=2018661 RepID=A0A2A2KAD7_9BILA|nr:hypothetical protein WR25_14680 [Diploscapter pachys]